MPVLTEISIAVLDDLTPVATFTCGDEELDDYLHNDALSAQRANLAQTYVALNQSEIVGYITLAADFIWITDDEKTQLALEQFPTAPRNIPGIKIGRLASSTKYRGCGIGKTLVWRAYQILNTLSPFAGCRVLTVDSYQNIDTLKFYTDLGFVHNHHPTYQGKRKSTVSLRFDAYAQTMPAWALTARPASAD